MARKQRGTLYQRCDFGSIGRSTIRESTVAEAFRLIRES
jgi:hypothetical protein